MKRRYKLPRCPCGAYAAVYAEAIGHTCYPEDPAPQKYAARNIEGRERAIELRRSGLTLQQVGDRMGYSRERIRQLIATSKVALCRDCKRPVELVPGRRRCAACYAKFMANRPSKKARRTGYRTSSKLHRTAFLVRLVNQGLDRSEIAARMGIQPHSVSQALSDMRREKGRDIKLAKRKPRGEGAS